MASKLSASSRLHNNIIESLHSKDPNSVYLLARPHVAICIVKSVLQVKSRTAGVHSAGSMYELCSSIELPLHGLQHFVNVAGLAARLSRSRSWKR